MKLTAWFANLICPLYVIRNIFAGLLIILFPDQENLIYEAEGAASICYPPKSHEMGGG